MQTRHETGIWNITYPAKLREAVEATAFEWKHFCSLPDEIQDIFTAKNMFNGVGFERKIGDGRSDSHFSHDKKLNFDITSYGIGELEGKLTSIHDVSKRKIAYAFIGAAKTLTEYASTAIEEFGAAIEHNYGINGFQKLAQKSAPNAFFRSLYYPPTHSTEEIIGEPHVDNSGFTLHLFESTEGCEALSKDRQSWYPMPVAKGSALAFPGMQTQLFSNGEVDGLCHRILSNETTCEVGRYAIVCFVPLNGVAPYNRSRYGRLQEKEPGFNYGMDSSKFNAYFEREG